MALEILNQSHTMCEIILQKLKQNFLRFCLDTGVAGENASCRPFWGTLVQPQKDASEYKLITSCQCSI